MTQQRITEYNVGQNLDDLANLDPRGYGVCRIIYEEARRLAGMPLSMNAAKKLASVVKRDDVVAIITGFVLIPHGKAEMDGIVSSMILARALAKAFGAKPLIVCPRDCLDAVKNLSLISGLHVYENPDDLLRYPISMGVYAFTKDSLLAEPEADALVSSFSPVAVISIEAPGANSEGVYHNAAGMDVSSYEAKSDVLFLKLQKAGALNIAIGDLGNEIGLGSLGAHLERYIPGARPGTCACGCGGGLSASTSADVIITATVSDWGCYAMISALAFLLEDIDIMADEALVLEMIVSASRNGMIDMWGWLIPSVDGCDGKMNAQIASLMMKTVSSALSLKKICSSWFDRVIPLGFYQERLGGSSLIASTTEAGL